MSTVSQYNVGYVTPQFRALMRSQKQYVEPANIRYNINITPVTNQIIKPSEIIQPQDLPKMFDPRHIETVPEKDISKWFYKDYKGNWLSVLKSPLDQGSCLSSWAFSSANSFSDTIRLNLLRLYGSSACVKSIFFQPSIVCTGETFIENENIPFIPSTVNRIYAEEVQTSISPYFTVSFSPKVKVVGNEIFIDSECNKAFKEWKEVISSPERKPGDLTKVLSEKYSLCLGCKANIIPCPLMLFTGAKEGVPDNPDGAPLTLEFTLNDWGCLWSKKEFQTRFCSPKFLEGSVVYDIPKLYKADYYSYVTQQDEIPDTIKSQGINNMVEWMKMSIYFYGPIIVSFNIYDSFLDFYNLRENIENVNSKKIYTADQFIRDYKNGKNEIRLGGHASAIVGWGEESSADNMSPPTKYWVARNTWGKSWGDRGYFRIEIDIDDKLQNAGIKQLIKLNDKFGALYFAPFPNLALNTSADGKINVNEMKDYLLPVETVKCPAYNEHENIVDEMDHHCQCRCGFYFDFKSGKCENSETTRTSSEHSKITSLSGCGLSRNNLSDGNLSDGNLSDGNLTDGNLSNNNFDPAAKIIKNNISVALIIIAIISMVAIIFLLITCLPKMWNNEDVKCRLPSANTNY